VQIDITKPSGVIALPQQTVNTALVLKLYSINFSSPRNDLYGIVLVWRPLSTQAFNVGEPTNSNYLTIPFQTGSAYSISHSDLQVGSIVDLNENYIVFVDTSGAGGLPLKMSLDDYLGLPGNEGVTFSLSLTFNY